MDDVTAKLGELAAATARFEELDSARSEARQRVVDLALDLLRAGEAEPGDVYARVPFTSTQMRSIARDAGIPKGRPGIKPSTGKKGTKPGAVMRTHRPRHGDA
jgi:hypothetical protein